MLSGTGMQKIGVSQLDRRSWRAWLDFSLTTKGMIVIGISLVCFLCLVVSLSIIQRQRASLDLRIERAFQAGTKIQTVLTVLSNAESDTRGFLLTGEASYLEATERAPAPLTSAFAALRKALADSPSQLERIAKVESLSRRKLAALQLLAAQRKSSGQSGRPDSRTLMDAMKRELTAMRTEEAGIWLARVEAEKTLRKSLSVTLYGAALLSMLAGGLAIRAQLVQEALEHQTNILQSVLTSIRDGVVVADTAGKFLFFNEAAGRVLQAGQTDAGPGGWTEHYGLFLPDTITPFPPDELPLARAIKGEIKDDVEIFVRNRWQPEGAWLTVTARPLRGKDGVLRGGVAVLNDTTERRRVHEILTQERNLLRTLIDQLPEYIFAKDEQSRYLLANAALMRAQGISTRDQIAGRTDSDFFPQHLTERYRAGDEAVLRSGQAMVDEEEPFVDQEGNTAWISTTKVPLRDAGGSIIGLVGICHDITVRKHNEERIEKLSETLRLRAEELETVNKELNAFSYSVSHDLRAPLRHIDGFAELLMKSAGPVLNEKSRRYVSTISQSAKELGQLIDDLLTFSRMGRSEMRNIQVSLDQLVCRAVEEIGRDAHGRDVSWKIAALPVIQGDPAMLRLVIVNLLSNAVKYTRKQAQAEIEIGSSSGPSGEIVVYVRDNGVGFDMQYVDKLFGVFQRLHGANEFEGTGIGLANVRRIIHRHGGRTWAEGAIDRGATFYFSLPQYEEAVPCLS
ncbi:MAG TPA: PAS domain-containing protein [Bryobacteraceae bacterium]|nr:PAS domain-containing protein [Bryobacteraceae bacterium]